MPTITVFLTSGTDWVVPAEWTTGNSIECIGGGSGSAQGTSGIDDRYHAAGAGGAYSKVNDVVLTPSDTVKFSVGQGSPTTNPGVSSLPGGDTWIADNDTASTINSPGVICGAKGASGATPIIIGTGVGTIGGQASAGIGATRFSGGNGATFGLGVTGGRQGGGGGAAGPHGPGGNGGVSHPTGFQPIHAYGGGGGGSGGGSNGADAIDQFGGAGGNNFFGSGGGAGGVGSSTPGTVGTDGGGGGGNASIMAAVGLAGGNGTEWGSAGSGGGGGAAGDLFADGGGPSDGGLYGGGGGCAAEAYTAGAGGGAGAPGIIVIKYGYEKVVVVPPPVFIPPSLSVWRGACGINWKGLALVGDAFTNVVGLSDFSIFTEYGNQMRMLVTSPPIHKDRHRIFVPLFEMQVEAGEGTPGDPSRAPLMLLDVSKDGGKTWQPLQKFRSMGKVGEYLKRLRWTQLGAARQWVFRFQYTDSARPAIIGTYITTIEGLG